MSITLTPVTRENWHICINLKVHPDQENFVASNLYSIAEAHFNPDWVTLLIEADGTPVGFAMIGPDQTGSMGRYYIIRFMIDAMQQKRGYGRAALQALIQHLQQVPNCHAIALSYVPENSVAAALYQAVGFVPTGELDEDEIVVQMVV